MTGIGKRKTAPWKHTENDRGWMRRKAAADARLAEHVYGVGCGPHCPKKPKDGGRA